MLGLQTNVLIFIMIFIIIIYKTVTALVNSFHRRNGPGKSQDNEKYLRLMAVLSFQMSVECVRLFYQLGEIKCIKCCMTQILLTTHLCQFMRTARLHGLILWTTRSFTIV